MNNEEAILKSLIAVAWADGKLDESELDVVDALIDAFEVTAERAEALRAFAKERQELSDLPLSDLSAADRRLLLQHATLLTHVDGDQSEAELSLLDQLVKELGIPAGEAQALIAATNLRAERIFGDLR